MLLGVDVSVYTGFPAGRRLGERTNSSDPKGCPIAMPPLQTMPIAQPGSAQVNLQMGDL